MWGLIAAAWYSGAAVVVRRYGPVDAIPPITVIQRFCVWLGSPVVVLAAVLGVGVAWVLVPKRYR